MKKILILTASFGDGHNAAARNLRDALELITDEAKVEVLGLFESTYGALNSLLKQTYQGLVRYVPTIWSGVFSVFDNPALFRRQTASMGKLRDSLAAVLHDTEPDVVVSCYPVYGHLIQDIFREHAERPFRFITVVTDSISICSAWYRAPSDLFIVANAATGEVLTDAGIPKHRVKSLGFPVSPVFAREQPLPLAAPDDGQRCKVLYVINTGKAKAGKSLSRLLKLPDLDLTITVGRDATLKAKLSERLREHGDRVHVYGWTNQMPRLLMSHHLVIAKAGGAMVQEAITDHVTDPRRLIGKFSELLNFTIAVGQLDEYFDMLERERRRAWRKYDMLVLTGLEFNREGFTRKTSGHLLGIDLKAPISPALGFVEIVAQIHSQGGLAVAAHPHVMKSEWGKNTLFLWENQEVFAPIIDAWEIANRNNIFTPVGLKRFAFLANSDFHKPKHIYSWKTILHCEKDPAAIKDCIRRNEHVSLTLYRDGVSGEALRAAPRATEALVPDVLSLRPALPAMGA